MTASQSFARHALNLSQQSRAAAAANLMRRESDPGRGRGQDYTSQITFDPQAISQAVGSLHETLARCETERQRLMALMNDARDINQHESEQASHPQTSAASQLRQWSEVDSWISRRLAELHAADDSLARREAKLEKLQGSLQQLAAGLAGQLQQLAQDRQHLAQQQQDSSRSMLDARRQLQQQQDELDRQLAAHEARVAQLNESLDAKLEAIDQRSREAGSDLARDFEKLAQGVAQRLDAVRKPVDKWLSEHLSRYERMLNDRLEAQELPVAQRIEAISQQVDQAVGPVLDRLATLQQDITTGLEEADAQLAQTVRVKTAELQRVMGEHMQSLEARLRRQAQQQSQAITAELAQSLQQLEASCSEKLTAFEDQIAQAGEAELAKAQAALDQGVDNLGSKALHFKAWFEKLHKHMTSELDDLMAHVQQATRQASEQLERHEQELTRDYPARIRHLMTLGLDGHTDDALAAPLPSADSRKTS